MINENKIELDILAALESMKFPLDRTDIGYMVIHGSLFPNEQLVKNTSHKNRIESWETLKMLVEYLNKNGFIKQVKPYTFVITFKGRWRRHMLENLTQEMIE